MENTIYVIGAGVSGLIAAYELEQKGYQPIIIEKSNEVGGRVKTLLEQDYHLDLGFQVLLTAYPMVKKYLDLKALDLQILASGALLYVNDKKYRIGDPTRDLSVLLPTIFAKIGTLSDKLKILILNRKLKNKSIEAIFSSPEIATLDYLKNLGFSDKIINLFFKPFFSGIFLEPNLHTSSRMFEFVYKMFGEGSAAIPKNGIGEIAIQLKNKLKKTTFLFNEEVVNVNSDFIKLASGETKKNSGVIITAEINSLVENSSAKKVKWKSCICWYFEVDKTNIPQHTIALATDENTYLNNLYTYQDINSGKTILSVTTLKQIEDKDSSTIKKIAEEVKKITGANNVNYIKHYKIPKALPDINHLKSTLNINENKLAHNVFIAGDNLLNGSLNAAMESGFLAAKSLIAEKK